MYSTAEHSWTVIRDLQRSERLVALQKRFDERYAAGGERIYTDDDAVRARNVALLCAYRATQGLPTILRRARALTEFAEQMPLAADIDDLLLGRQTFNGKLWLDQAISDELSALGYAATTGHIVHDYAGLLQQGISGYRQRLDEALNRTDNDASRTTLTAFRQALDAFQRFIERHAQLAESITHEQTGKIAQGWQQRANDLRRLTIDPPQTFAQALQLLWFAHIFLHAENPSVAISFGRIDQYLWPFLHADLDAQRISLQDAYDLACAFLLKCCEGEESQNAVLGGVTTEGNDAANPLSLLFIAAMCSMKTFQPSLTVRVHPTTDDDFLTAACALVAAGTGNPGFMNDPAVIPALQALDIPVERARDWGVVGCYEATPQGDAYPNTVLARLHLVNMLTDYLQTSEAQHAPTFQDFMGGWLQCLKTIYHTTLLPDIQQSWNNLRDYAPSPFGSLLMRGCIERALPLEAGGTLYNMVGINMLGLGDIVDSMLAIRSLVFQQHEMTMATLAQAVAADFPDEAMRLRLQRVPGRYGSDSEESNQLAEEISDALARMVLESRLDDGVRPYPSFFAFGADIYALDHASPDGRRAHDLISYGVSASTTVPTTPTSLLHSASHVAQKLAACGNPIAITLQRRDTHGDAGIQLVKQLVQSYFALGGSHLHFNVASPDDLRQAQDDPQHHADLTVRVSGYSARFVTVDRVWQDALIARAEQGI